MYLLIKLKCYQFLKFSFRLMNRTRMMILSIFILQETFCIFSILIFFRLELFKTRIFRITKQIFKNKSLFKFCSNHFLVGSSHSATLLCTVPLPKQEVVAHFKVQHPSTVLAQLNYNEIKENLPLLTVGRIYKEEKMRKHFFRASCLI